MSKRTHDEMSPPSPSSGSGVVLPPASSPPLICGVSIPPPAKRPAPSITMYAPQQSTIQQNMPKVQDALGYLEKVKTRFSQAPAVYNQFLDIMKDFKSQCIDTEGVIRRVKSLFRGNRSLILGFNQFLPPGYKIDLDPPPPPAQPRPTVEFKQAMEYVAKIKARFRDQPSIYADFLDILHDYQAKRTIDEVYQRVQKLFVNQPDLLDEFKFFLPESATQRLNAQSSTANKKAVKQPKPAKQTKKSNEPAPANTLNDKSKPVIGVGSSSKSARRPPQPPPSKKEDKKSAKAVKPTPARVTFPEGSEKELALFEKMRQFMSKPQWVQFLKALNLSANDVISRTELVRMLEDVLGDKSSSADWIEKFKTTIGYSEAEEKSLARAIQSNYYAFVASVDFTTCRQVSPSYRELPKHIAVPHCSGRTQLCDEVLNDTCVSIPTGSEDFSFKSTRKNVYEENLFKCEDERFELDMVIENNSAAIRVLEPLAEQIASMPPEQLKRVRLPDTVDILHVRAIARVYGEQGYEMVEMLQKAPTNAVPIVLTRLRQKDAEWRKVRNEMKAQWRKVNEQNYQRSLDHRSFYFKQEDNKRRRFNALTTELKEVQHAVFGGSAAASEELTGEESLMLRSLRQGQPPNPLYSHCMRFKFPDADIHQQVFAIIAKVAATLYSEQEQLRIFEFFTGFMGHWYNVQLNESNQKIIEQTQEAYESKKHEAENAPADEPVKMEESDDEEEKKAAAPAPATAATPPPTVAAPAAAASVNEETPSEDAKKSVANRRTVKRKSAKRTNKKNNNRKPPASNAAAAAAVKEEKGDDDEDDEKDKEAAAPPKEDEPLPESHPDSLFRNAQRTIGFAKKDEQEIEDEDVVTSRSKSSQYNMGEVVTRLQAAVHPASAPSASVATLLKELDVYAPKEDEKKLRDPYKKHGKASKFFVGSRVFYVLFRLHQFLYDRLLTAKTLTHKTRRTSTKKKNVPVTPEERHARFNTLLHALIDNEIETSKFEDELRNLLGASSYVLFTLDKLVQQLVKITLSLVNNDSNVEFLLLYAAELELSHSLPAGVDAQSKFAKQYSSFASLLCDPTSGEFPCVIEYFEETQELGMSMPDDTASLLPIEGWVAFCERFRQQVVPAHMPFITRSCFNSIASYATQLPAIKANDYSARVRSWLQRSQDVWSEALKQCVWHDGLKIQLDSRSLRYHFTPKTTSLFARKRHSNKYNYTVIYGRRAKSAAFNNGWLAARLSEIPLAIANKAAQSASSTLSTLFQASTGEEEAENEGEGEAEAEGEVDAEGDADNDAEGEGEADADGEGDAEVDGEGDDFDGEDGDGDDAMDTGDAAAAGGDNAFASLSSAAEAEDMDDEKADDASDDDDEQEDDEEEDDEDNQEDKE